MQVRFFHNACYNLIFDEMWLIRVEYINEMGLKSILIIASSKILIFFTRRENSLRENKSKYDESRDSEVVYRMLSSRYAIDPTYDIVQTN